MKRHPLHLLLFLLGLAVVAWIALAHAAANPWVLLVTVSIGGAYVAGALELDRYRRATLTLQAATAGLSEPPADLDAWLATLDPALRGAVRLRIDGERDSIVRAGQRAVDLGAAPGGWTWQLVHRGLRVTAIDNGPLRDSVMATEMVEHFKADGFTWRPHRPVDWMVCDMVEQPSRIASLVAEWIATGRCRYAIFNLKLPMKRRVEAVEQCRELIRKRLNSVGPFDLRIKHLYHDREEVTAFLTLKR